MKIGKNHKDDHSCSGDIPYTVHRDMDIVTVTTTRNSSPPIALRDSGPSCNVNTMGAISRFISRTGNIIHCHTF
jgi:hypothetical protein